MTVAHPHAARRSAPRDREDGLTLVELMVAMLVIGVILSATASSLIVLMRDASANERRVQATQAMTRLHEDFATIPFELTALYQAEAADLEDLAAMDPPPPAEVLDGFDFSGSFPTFEARPIALLPDAAARNPGVPRPVLVGPLGALAPVAIVDPDEDDEDAALVGPEPTNRDEYQVVQVVTDIDRSGDGVADVRRLTTFVSWNWLGRTYTERLDSERAPTVFEGGDPTEARGFVTVSGSVILGPDEELRASMPVLASFTQPVTSARVEFRRLRIEADGTRTLVPSTVHLTGTLNAPSGYGFTRFAGSIPTTIDGEDTRFDASVEEPVVAIELIGSPGAGSPDIRATSLTRLSIGDESAVDVTAAAVSPSNVTLTETGMSCAITIDATVQGLTPDNYSVQASWVAGGVRRTTSMEPLAGEASIVPGGSQFTAQLETGDRHGFRPGDQVRFDIRASGGASADEALIGEDVRETANLVSFSTTVGGPC